MVVPRNSSGRPKKRGGLYVRLGANRDSMCPLMSAAIVLTSLLAVTPARSDELQDIIPGHAFGPVMLGMPATKAYAAATRFERETGCGIDLLIAHGVVIAAGSKWGGCLHLPAYRGIGSPAIALVRVFGTPLIVRRGADEAALLFPNGLVAYVNGMPSRGGGVVAYLAVQVRGSAVVPRIGYLAREDTDAHESQAP